MNICNKTHLRTFRSHFEVACLFGILAISVDILWVIHDILANGLNTFYFSILLGLCIANLGTIYVVWKHHSKLVRKIRRTLLMDKITHNKRINKHRGK